ncbi:MAG TPA: hypothetical protein VLE49_14215 [Anaerolineales bacterium]|nr:hypothetical protein [Anaerolineales bacterium]
MQSNFSEVERRVKRYWYTDGLWELIGGGMFILLGLYFSLQQYFGDQSPMGVILQSSLILFLIAAIFLGRRLINALKGRLTYPRTGYVEYQTVEKNSFWRRILTMTIAMTIAMFMVVISRRVDALDSTAALTGALVAVILLVKQGWSSGMPRFYLLSAVSLILGVALSVSGLPSGYNLAVYYGLMGIAFAISGGLTLRHYLHENPLPADAEPRNG